MLFYFYRPTSIMNTSNGSTFHEFSMHEKKKEKKVLQIGNVSWRTYSFTIDFTYRCDIFPLVEILIIL